MIHIKELSFEYKKKKPVLQDISFSLTPGIYGLLGENGSGKTTLLHLMSGLLFPVTGSCTFMDVDLWRRNPDTRQQLFFLSEEFELPSESLEKFAVRHAIFYPEFNKEQLENYLQEFQLDLHTPLSDYSYGQKKKAMLAYAIALNTPLLLLDEPTNGLDITSTAEFKRIQTQAATKEKCIVVSTHQVTDFENLLDGVIILSQQRLLLAQRMEKIVDKLHFSVTEKAPADALYLEEALQGYRTVRLNDKQEESTVRLDLLYLAVVRNAATINNLFNKREEV